MLAGLPKPVQRSDGARSYYTFGYSVNDARKPFLVHPPDAVEGAASAAPPSDRSVVCSRTAWNGVPPPTQAWRQQQPVPCGVLWFLHISKTGGETVRSHLRGRARKHGWSFLDMYTSTSPRSLRRPGRWEIERHVHVLAQHLNQTRPRLVVHQHDGVGGFGEYFLDRVLRPLSCRWQQSASECKVVLTTVLRDPVARTISQAQSDGLPPAEFAAFARAQANFQTKYILFGTDWRVRSLFLANATVEQSLLGPVRSVLSHFALIGRTEELGTYLTALDSVMDWAQPGSNHTAQGHRSKLRWNLTRTQAEDAHRFSTVDAELYRTFCSPLDVGASVTLRPATPLCSSASAVHGLPHYYLAEGTVEKQTQSPAPSKWQMVFDGRGCHGFPLGNAYRLQCADQVQSTLGSSFGTIAGYKREKGGRLVPTRR